MANKTNIMHHKFHRQRNRKPVRFSVLAMNSKGKDPDPDSLRWDVELK